MLLLRFACGFALLAVSALLVGRTSTRFANQNHGILLPQIDPLWSQIDPVWSQTQSDLSRLSCQVILPFAETRAEGCRIDFDNSGRTRARNFERKPKATRFRNREPSRICLKKMLNSMKKRTVRKRLKLTVGANTLFQLPCSSGCVFSVVYLNIEE